MCSAVSILFFSGRNGQNRGSFAPFHSQEGPGPNTESSCAVAVARGRPEESSGDAAYGAACTETRDRTAARGFVPADTSASFMNSKDS